jgi:tetratricopeptide (TPR) repeat protein
MGKQKKKSEADRTWSSTLRYIAAALAGFIVLRNALAHEVVVLPRAWGLDFARFHEMNAWVLLALWLPLLFLLPFVVNGLAARLARTGPATSTRSGVAIVLVASGLAAMAWFIPTAYAFLGDGSWYAAELYRSMSLPGYSNSMIKPSAWLTGVLLDGFAREFVPEDIRLPFRLAGALGMLAATIAVLYSTWREAAAPRLLFFSTLICGAGALVFFGYVELYAFVYAGSLAYLASAYAALRGHASVFVPGIILLVTLAFGLIAIVWLPSYLLLLHWRFRGEGGGLPLPRAALLLIVAPVAAIPLLYLFVGSTGDNPYLVALAPFDRVVNGMRTGIQGYTLFEPLRFVDIFNGVALALGPSAVVGAVLLMQARRKGIWTRPTALFAVVAAAGGALLLIFGNTFLGLARDWDVAAFTLLGAALLVAVLIVESRSRDTTELARIAVMLAAAMLSHTGLWIALNVDGDASAERFATLVDADEALLLPMNSFTGWENLRKYYQSGGETERYFDVLERQIATGYRKEDGYAEYLSSALQIRDAGRREQVMRALLHMYEDDAVVVWPEDDIRHRTPRAQREAVTRLMVSLEQTGMGELAAEARQRFSGRFVSWPELDVWTLLREGGSASDVSSRLAVALDEADSDAFLLMSAGGLAQSAGVWEDAARYYDAALRREPSLYPSWYLVAADFHARVLRDTGRAEELLRDCLRQAPGSSDAQRAAEMLRQLHVR